MNDRLVSIREAASRLGVSVRTVWRMIADGQLPKPTKVRARSMVPERHLDAIVGGEGAARG